MISMVHRSDCQILQVLRRWPLAARGINCRLTPTSFSASCWHLDSLPESRSSTLYQSYVSLSSTRLKTSRTQIHASGSGSVIYQFRESARLSFDQWETNRQKERYWLLCPQEAKPTQPGACRLGSKIRIVYTHTPIHHTIHRPQCLEAWGFLY
jgi:hypothetical protein